MIHWHSVVDDGFTTAFCPTNPAQCTVMNVLVIDDEPTLRRAVRAALETSGHTVNDAATGAAAVRLASEKP